MSNNELGSINHILFSPNGKYIGYQISKKIKLWDIKNKKFKIIKSNNYLGIFTFNPNNKNIVFIQNKKLHDILTIWDIEREEEIKAMRLNSSNINSLIFGPNGKYIVLGDGKDIRLLNSINGKEIMILKGHSSTISSLSLHQNGKYLVSGSQDNTIKLWNIKSGKCIKTFIGHNDSVESVVFSLNGKNIISGSLDGTIKKWDIKTGKELVSMISFNDGEWITITPDGYFDASENGAKYLNILTDPLTVTSIDAYYEKFYRPDIVKLAMQGKTVDGLTKILDIKPAPVVKILNIGNESSNNSIDTTNEDNIDITVRIIPKSGGVGEIRILVNGTAKTLDTRAFKAQGRSAPFDKTYNIKLSHGINEIKALAFESTNSARSDESVYKIKSTFKPLHKPTIHALVIGVQEYRNSKFNLKYTRDDAKIFADALESQKNSGLFSDVKVTMLTSQEETSKENILKELEKFKSMNENDVFVFYVGSHGTIDDGSYYLITSNVGSTSTRKLKTDALSQKELQVAISNIQASKKFIVLDTCNSGKLGEELQQRVVLTRGMSESTAIKILSRAMGSTILSASKSDQEAVEGYKGHGLFTYVLVEGLNGKADSNKDGFVKTLELANYVEDEVPNISQKEFSHEQFPNVNTSGQAFPVSRVK
ncbi:MAG: High-affnity carbon uptake protein Hat/HatR [uncultured Sulfurovum sp.]|uniref:High-affnity carbon uptake protein Hat/HatR n=1 Tax=uncultured Sulfurovum sp. TaxID=269237 RepID=A0A6S6TJU4_9BACT|nr:MAG: High-affnity carbon uptake protein Hat/HatR [uncultured Sulfurovum sp.]